MFGSDAYAHIPKEERKKLDFKGRKCVFVGYGDETKGYRLYDPAREKIFFSRNVVFDETKHAIASKFTELQGVRRIEVDVSSDDVSLDSGSESESEPETDPAESATVQPPPRRSMREKHFPDYFGRSGVNLVAKMEPCTVDEALSSPEKDCWLDTMKKEMNSLEENDVWELVELPAGRKPVGSKWVFKTKTNADGKIERYKARLVAQGFSQKFGSDYDETFCPVVRLESVRAVIALSVQYGLELHQVDVTTAFLNGELEEEVFMEQPDGFVTPGREGLVCKLKKSIYGLKQSPRCWNVVLDSFLREIGFVQADSDP